MFVIQYLLTILTNDRSLSLLVVVTCITDNKDLLYLNAGYSEPSLHARRVSLPCGRQQ